MKPAIILLLFTISISARMFPTYQDTGSRLKPIKIPIIQKEASNAELTDVIGTRESFKDPVTSVIDSLKQMEFLLKDITDDMVTSPVPPSTTQNTPAVTDLKKVAKVKKYIAPTMKELLLLLALIGLVLAYPTSNETSIDQPQMDSQNDPLLIVITEKMDFHEERQKYLRQVEERNQREFDEINKFWEESERLEQLEKEKKEAEDQKWFDDFNEFWNTASYVEEDRKAQEEKSDQARACLHLLFIRLCFWF